MIHEALTCITEEINEYFRNKLKINEEKMVISGIVNQDGSLAVQGENKIIVTLVNLEKENTGNGVARTNGFMGGTNGPLNLNMYVLFSAYFASSNYGESLRFLSFIVGYFQQKSVFNKANTPKIHPRIDKLILEMTDLNPDTLSNMWSTLGAKYMPSVLYKIRMLSFDEGVVREFRPAIDGVSRDNSIYDK